ncbi:MAG TPA: hypothetical protein VFV67_22755 [Actinophytocola sp.]|uniref:hypothetical protein n=1 Tax=Actinophytocola sp. TaxID=1872138 RepID=UPI002DB596EE|nr:hypothetical protein [Actinophytocola sp.]HEU5473475.1 hypothetical protein [Actinophytocola sp.]
MRTDVSLKPPGCIYRTRKRGPFLMDGYFGATYNVDTVAVIDAHIRRICYRRPRHPDVDLLLDARQQIGLNRAVWD